MLVSDFIIYSKSQISNIGEKLNRLVLGFFAQGESFEVVVSGADILEIGGNILSVSDSDFEIGKFLAQILEKHGVNHSATSDSICFSYALKDIGQSGEIFVILPAYTCEPILSKMLAAPIFPSGQVSCTDKNSIILRVLSSVLSEFLLSLSPNIAPVVESNVESAINAFGRVGSGAISVKINFGEYFFIILLPAPVVKLLFEPISEPSKAFSCTPRSEYLAICAGAAIEVEIKLPATKAVIADLQHLAVNQVIPIGCDLDRPLDMFVNGKKTDLRVFLGKVHKTRAVKIETLAGY